MLTVFFHGDWMTVVAALLYWAFLFGVPVLLIVLIVKLIVGRKT